MADIHPSAVVDPAAQLASGVSVGPFCFIGPGVTVGAGTRFGPGTVVHGPTAIGEGNIFTGQSSIGGDSQDLKGSAGSLEIGDRNTVREFATINRATGEGSVTKVGSGNLVMAYAHIAHDCRIGDGTVIANAVQLAGELTVGDRAVLGGACAVHQRVRIGALAFIGGMTGVSLDVPPYTSYTVRGDRTVVGVNRVGLERAGMGDAIPAVSEAQQILYRRGLPKEEAIRRIELLAKDSEALGPLADFLGQPSDIGIVRPRSGRARQ